MNPTTRFPSQLPYCSFRPRCSLTKVMTSAHSRVLPSPAHSAHSPWCEPWAVYKRQGGYVPGILIPSASMNSHSLSQVAGTPSPGLHETAFPWSCLAALMRSFSLYVFMHVCCAMMLFLTGVWGAMMSLAVMPHPSPQF